MGAFSYLTGALDSGRVPLIGSIPKGAKLEHQPWREFGKCASLSSDEADSLFFIGRGKSSSPAKKFCSTCIVNKQCLFFAMYYDEKGIWAGTTYEERQGLLPIFMPMLSESIEVTFIETRDFRDFLPKQRSSLESLDSFGWDNERLIG